MLDPKSAPLTLALLNNSIDKPFKDINRELKVVNTGLNKYSKALDKVLCPLYNPLLYERLTLLDQKFKDKPLPTSEYDALSSRSSLIDRAIAMHLLREGQFSVASAFVQDANTSSSGDEMDVGLPGQISLPDPKLGIESVTSEELRKQFASMHNVLEELKKKNLLPAIGWARANSKALEKRGSNLEFELGKLQFIHLFLGGSSHNDTQNRWEGQQRALEYARQEFGPFQHRYLREIQQLIGAMAFSPNLKQSPYRRIFCNDDAWDELGNTFMREFCSLLGLSAESPLYIAATAGAIALPTLLKLQTIMKERRTEWTTQHELPVLFQSFRVDVGDTIWRF